MHIQRGEKENPLNSSCHPKAKFFYSRPPDEVECPKVSNLIAENPLNRFWFATFAPDPTSVALDAIGFCYIQIDPTGVVLNMYGAWCNSRCMF